MECLGLLYVLILLALAVLLTLQVVYNSRSPNFRVLFLELQNEPEPPPDSGAQIEGLSRFEWYRTQNNMHGLKTAANVSTFYAYEFDHEYSITLTSWNFMGSKAFCRYVDSSGNEIGVSEERFSFPEYIVHCRKRKGTAKIGISVAENADFQPLPLLDRTGTARKYNLSMCLTPIYGDEPKWLMFIETIEHYKLQGVEHFYVYILNVSAYDLKVISEYVRIGDVEVHFLLERDVGRPDWKWQLVHIADCLMRSRESRWTIFGDLDERFLMNMKNETMNLRDYMMGIEDPRVAGVEFRQQFVLKTHRMEERYRGPGQILATLPSIRYRNTTGVASKGYASKCIVDSSKVFRMDIHSVGAFYPGHDYHLTYLSGDLGVIRHYRDTNLGNWSQVYLQSMIDKFGALTLTDYPEKLLGELTANVRRRAEYVYGNDL